MEDKGYKRLPVGLMALETLAFLVRVPTAFSRSSKSQSRLHNSTETRKNFSLFSRQTVLRLIFTRHKNSPGRIFCYQI